MSKVPIWGIVVWVVAGAVLGLLWAWPLWAVSRVFQEGISKGQWGSYYDDTPYLRLRSGYFELGSAGAVLLSTWVLVRRGWGVAFGWLAANTLLTLGITFTIENTYYYVTENEEFTGFRLLGLDPILTVAALPTAGWGLAVVAEEVRSRLEKRSHFLALAGVTGFLAVAVATMMLGNWAYSCERSWSWKPNADLSGCNLSGADISGRNLQRANLARANLARASLRDADLDMADLRGANLEGANLTRANLARADLARGANLAGANLAGADLDMADLRGANLEGANLAGAYLTGYPDGANLEGANFTGASYDRSTRYPAGFDPAARGMRFVAP